MKRLTVFVTTCLAALTALGQASVFQPVHQKNLLPDLAASIFHGAASQFYLSDDGQRVVVNNDQFLGVLDGATGEKLLMQPHPLRLHAVASALTGFTFDEGTEFLVDEEKDRVWNLAWNRDENHITCAQLSDGKVLWTTDRFRYTPSKDAQLLTNLISNTVWSSPYYGGYYAFGTRSSLLYMTLQETQLNTRQWNQRLRKVITYLPGTDGMLIASGDGLHLVDAATGEERWHREDFKGLIGFAEYVPSSQSIVLVGYFDNVFKGSDREIISVSATDGKERWKAEYGHAFVWDRTYLQGDRLVLAYRGMEIYDVADGRKLLETTKAESKGLQGLRNLDAALNYGGAKPAAEQEVARAPFFDGDDVYYAVERSGGVYATSGVPKLHIRRYRLSDAKLVWETKDRYEMPVPERVVGGKLVLSAAGNLHGRYYGVDVSDGKTKWESDKVRDFARADRRVPAFLDKDYVYHVGKKEVAVIRLTDGEQQGSFDLKETNRGRIRAVGALGDGLITLHQRGVGFFRPDGTFEEALKVKNVEGLTWNQQYAFVFTEDGLRALDLEQRRLVDKLPAHRQFVFSGDRSHLMSISADFFYTLYQVE